MQFYFPLESIKIILGTFPISLNISHRIEEEKEDFPRKAGRRIANREQHA